MRQRSRTGASRRVCLLICAALTVGSGPIRMAMEPGDAAPACQLKFQWPVNAPTKDRVESAARWIERHLVRVASAPDGLPLTVVAWKDPTLAPDRPRLLAGYLITDTLWSAKALAAHHPGLATQLLSGLERLGWSRNGLHEVLFRPVERLLHCPADADIVHGHSLGVFPVDDGVLVDLRVFRQRWDPDFDVGHPTLFAEHAVYRAMNEYWHGEGVKARDRIRRILQPLADPSPVIFWDRLGEVLVDEVTRVDWNRWQHETDTSYRNYTFKVGLLLFATRVFDLERELPVVAKQIEDRLWSAQNADGGVAHFVDVGPKNRVTRADDATGEACAVAILAETVVSLAAGE